MMDTKIKKIILVAFAGLFTCNLMADEENPPSEDVDRSIKKNELNRLNESRDLEVQIKNVFSRKKPEKNGFTMAKQLCENSAWKTYLSVEKLTVYFGRNRVHKIKKNYYAVAIGDISSPIVSKERPIISKRGQDWFLIVNFNDNMKNTFSSCYLCYTTVQSLRSDMIEENN